MVDLDSVRELEREFLNYKTLGLVLFGMIVGLFAGMNLYDKLSDKFLGRTLGDLEDILRQPKKILTADEICTSVYFCDSGYGNSLARISCMCDGKWENFGLTDFSDKIRR